MNTASTCPRFFFVLTRLLHTAFKSSVLFTCLICIGCVSASYKNPKPPDLPTNARVLLMPVNIQLFELTVGGLEEPKADWTATAQKHVHSALNSLLAEKKDTVLLYEPPTDNPEKARSIQQLIKLYEVVGQTMWVHTYFEGYKLPTKKDAFDWSLGSGVRQINEGYDANVALFIYIRDSYASAGRKAAMVVGALAGIVVAGGAQTGFASLVDLDDGNILWTGRLYRPTGDLRTPGPAKAAVAQLLSEIPL